MPSRGDGTNVTPVSQRRTNSIDRAIGKQVRHYRMAAGLDIATCAERIGVTIEMFEQFERGKERVPAAHLVLLTGVLGVDVAVFFEHPRPKQRPADDLNVVELKVPRKAGASSAEMERQLLYSFRSVKRRADRQLLLDLATRLAETCTSASGK